MKPRTLLLVLAMACSVGAWAQAADPDKVLADISTALRSQEGTPQERAAKARSMAEEALKGVDLGAVEAAKALAWANLAQRMQRFKDVAMLVDKFLGTSPGEPQLSQAYTLGIVASAYNDDAKKGLALADMWAPADEGGKISKANMVFNWLGDSIATVKGDAGAESYIRGILGQLPATPADARMANALAGAIAGGYQAIAEVHEKAGDTSKAIAAIDEGLGKITVDGAKRGLNSKKSQLTLIGQDAPAIEATKVIGDFNGLAALKGKIVVLDFFAHWCGPCKASFPDLRKLYADLKEKGVEIVHATTFYGTFEQERGLTVDQEFAKMQGFTKDNGLVWPVVFVDRKAFEAYGVSGIPHIVLIDEKGKINKFKIGYSPETFAAFRKHIEEMLARAQKS